MYKIFLWWMSKNWCIIYFFQFTFYFTLILLGIAPSRRKLCDRNGGSFNRWWHKRSTCDERQLYYMYCPSINFLLAINFTFILLGIAPSRRKLCDRNGGNFNRRWIKGSAESAGHEWQWIPDTRRERGMEWDGERGRREW